MRRILLKILEKALLLISKDLEVSENSETCFMKILNPMDRIDYQHFEKYTKRWHTKFLGIKQGHTYWVYKVIDDILGENRHIKGIIEIGTGSGALSVFLGLECYERNLKPLLTFDTEKINIPRLFSLLNIEFIIQDCFFEESVKKIREYSNVPVLFICDGGNKIKEFNKFAYLLPKGSIIAAHDWTHEIYYEAIKDTIKKLELEQVKKETWCAFPDYILMSFWKKTK